MTRPTDKAIIEPDMARTARTMATAAIDRGSRAGAEVRRIAEEHGGTEEAYYAAFDEVMNIASKEQP